MEYIAFVNAVLGGFAFAFLGAMITVEKKSKVLSAAFIVTAIAAGLFLVATLGATMLAGTLQNIEKGNLAEEVMQDFRPIRRWMSMAFIFGVFFLSASIGIIGWVRSRNVGIATTIISVLIALGAWFMIYPFIN